MKYLTKIKKKIIAKAKYELGINRIVEENDSMFYLLNNCIDITKIPPTKDPELRILQKCDAVLLAIFDKLCQKNNLSYWLHWGTLLGAVRHGGFIPWDDDADVAMPRDDYSNLFPVMKKDIEALGLNISFSDIHPMRGLVLSCGNNTGVWIDIFPMDSCKACNEDELFNTVQEYRSFFWNNMNLSSEELIVKKRDILSTCPSGDLLYYIPSLEVWRGALVKALYLSNDIFPLKKIGFEGFELNVPQRADNILFKSYGADYMSFPRNAINKHGHDDMLPLSQRAKANGVDMNEVYKHLQSIYNSL